MNELEIREENRKIRYLRFLVDFSILSIQQDDLLLQEALELVGRGEKGSLQPLPWKRRDIRIDLSTKV